MPKAHLSRPEDFEGQGQHRWEWASPLLVAAVSLISTLILTGSTGHLARVDETFSALFDARRYLLVSEYLVGNVEKIPDYRILGKPILYPVFLSLHNLIGIRAFALLQLLLNAASVVIVWSLVAGLTRSRFTATIATLPIISSVTLMYFTLFAMTEPLAVALSATSMFLVARHARLRTIDSALHVLAAMMVAVCVKPLFLPCVVFWIVYVTALVGHKLLWYKSQIEDRPYPQAIISACVQRVPLLVLVILPVLLQAGGAYVTVGAVGGWRVGSSTLGTYFFPIVYGFVEAGRLADDFVDKNDPMATEAQRIYPETSDKVRYLAAHPVATVRTGLFTLFTQNIAQQSRALWETRNLVPYDSLARRITGFSRWVNTGSAGLHIIFFFLVPLSVLVCTDSTIRRFLVLGFPLAWLLLGTASLAYWAGDRLVTPSLPAWASVYAISVWTIAMRIWPRVRRPVGRKI